MAAKTIVMWQKDSVAYKTELLEDLKCCRDFYNSDSSKWCRFVYARRKDEIHCYYDDPEATSWDIVGVLGKNIKVEQRRYNCYAELLEEVKRQGFNSIVHFNDSDKVNFDMFIGVFSEIINRLEKENASKNSE